MAVSDKLEQVLDRWMTDARFREAMRQDREAAVRQAGIPLEAEDWAALQQLELPTGDEALQPRVSKYPPLRSH